MWERCTTIHLTILRIKVSMMAPKHLQKSLSYVAGTRYRMPNLFILLYLHIMLGWLTLAGWQAAVASAAFLCGALIQGLLVLTQPTYVPENWHTTLLYWAVIAFCVFINVAAGWLLPKFEGSLLVLHLLGFFGVLIPLLILGPKGNSKDVFTTFANMGGW